MLNDLLDQVIAIDTNTAFAYVGLLRSHDDDWIRLSEVAVYDRHDSRVSLEKFLIECRTFGHGSARGECLIQRHHVIAITPLEAVVAP